MSDSKPIRVLQIVPAMNVDSGVASFLMNYLRSMDHDKFIVDFAMYKKHDTPYYREIKSYGGHVYLLPQIMSARKHQEECNILLEKNSYDIVHDSCLTKSFPLMRSAYLHEIPVRILHSHNANLGDSTRKKIINKMVLSKLKSYSTDFFACSKAAGDCYFDLSDYTVVPNVIENSCFIFNSGVREQVRNKMDVQDKIVICTVGRMAQQKNPYFALDVIKKLKEAVPEIVYWWIGTGALTDSVKEYAQKIGINQHVRFWGGRTDMVDMYQAMDIFFLPSLFEGLPLTGVETQAMGLPSVVSDTITDEMVYTDLVKYVSLQDPIDAWVEALEEQIKRIPERRSYTEELKKSQFSAEGAGERLEKLYRDLLTKNIGASHS